MQKIEPMAPTLDDFFGKSKKKNIKSSNLNNESAKPAGDEKKKATKEKEEEGWEEEQIAATTLKVEVAGKLLREDDRKEEDDSGVPKWSKKKGANRTDITERHYPTLAKSVRQQTNISLDDGNRNDINIKTSKNIYQALDEENSDDDEPLRPREIKPARVEKKKGEMASHAIQREVDKYDTKNKNDANKPKSKEVNDDDDDDEEEDKPRETKKKTKKKFARTENAEYVEVDDADDTKITPDLEASRKKYVGREKLPRKDLPDSEMQEENTKKQQQPSKKKKMAIVEEVTKPKLQYWED